MVKTFKDRLLQNQKSYDLETSHLALGTQALQSLYKWWLWVDLDPFYLLSRLSPQRLIGELIVYPCSGVRRRCCCRRPPFSNVFSSENALPIKWMKVYINGQGHMTKMAAMPIYGKNLKNYSSPEPEVLWSWKLACIIGDSSSTKFI